MGLFSKIFGTNSQRQIKALEGIADQVDALEEEYKKKTDAEETAEAPAEKKPTKKTAAKKTAAKKPATKAKKEGTKK